MGNLFVVSIFDQNAKSILLDKYEHFVVVG